MASRSSRSTWLLALLIVIGCGGSEFGGNSGGGMTTGGAGSSSGGSNAGGANAGGDTSSGGHDTGGTSASTGGADGTGASDSGGSSSGGATGGTSSSGGTQSTGGVNATGGAGTGGAASSCLSQTPEAIPSLSSLDCNGLATLYASTLTSAKVCGCENDCSVTACNDFCCNCRSFVNPNSARYAWLDAIQKEAAARPCITVCTAIFCQLPTSASCLSGSSGSVCQNN